MRFVLHSTPQQRPLSAGALHDTAGRWMRGPWRGGEGASPDMSSWGQDRTTKDRTSEGPKKPDKNCIPTNSIVFPDFDALFFSFDKETVERKNRRARGDPITRGTEVKLDARRNSHPELEPGRKEGKGGEFPGGPIRQSGQFRGTQQVGIATRTSPTAGKGKKAEKREGRDSDPRFYTSPPLTRFPDLTNGMGWAYRNSGMGGEHTTDTRQEQESKGFGEQGREEKRITAIPTSPAGDAQISHSPAGTCARAACTTHTRRSGVSPTQTTTQAAG
ncbi:hypothetical protein BC826DRAFT_966875 [Russula brevipes]|nr:hypothetical protein BC826DRAFT_966875 [Russula brevipes]